MMKFSYKLNLLLVFWIPAIYCAAPVKKIDANKIHSVVIVGGGAAGLSAAKYLARAKFNPVLIEGDTIGGQLNKASMITNWPVLKPMVGTDIVEEMHTQAKELGTIFIESAVKKIDKTNGIFALTLENGSIIKARCIIITTGAKPKKLPLPGNEKYLGKGVALCAKCDAPLFKNKKVVVIGGSYSALRELCMIEKFAGEITVITKKDDLEGPMVLVHPVKENPKIKILTNCEAKEIVGDETCVTGVKLHNAKTNKTEEIPADGVFICVGWNPSTEIVENLLKLDKKKYIEITDTTKTSVDGIFAAGDVTNKIYHQAATASGFGYMAAMDAENYLKQGK